MYKTKHPFFHRRGLAAARRHPHKVFLVPSPTSRRQGCLTVPAALLGTSLTDVLSNTGNPLLGSSRRFPRTQNYGTPTPQFSC